MTFFHFFSSRENSVFSWNPFNVRKPQSLLGLTIGSKGCDPAPERHHLCDSYEQPADWPQTHCDEGGLLFLDGAIAISSGFTAIRGIAVHIEEWTFTQSSKIQNDFGIWNHLNRLQRWTFNLNCKGSLSFSQMRLTVPPPEVFQKLFHMWNAKKLSCLCQQQHNCREQYTCTYETPCCSIRVWNIEVDREMQKHLS